MNLRIYDSCVLSVSTIFFRMIIEIDLRISSIWSFLALLNSFCDIMNPWELRKSLEKFLFLIQFLVIVLIKSWSIRKHTWLCWTMIFKIFSFRILHTRNIFNFRLCYSGLQSTIRNLYQWFDLSLKRRSSCTCHLKLNVSKRTIIWNLWSKNLGKELIFLQRKLS